jgi:hypothetical protein
MADRKDDFSCFAGQWTEQLKSQKNRGIPKRFMICEKRFEKDMKVNIFVTYLLKKIK